MSLLRRGHATFQHSNPLTPLHCHRGRLRLLAAGAHGCRGDRILGVLALYEHGQSDRAGLEPSPRVHSHGLVRQFAGRLEHAEDGGRILDPQVHARVGRRSARDDQR